jgi:hypothetical protein
LFAGQRYAPKRVKLTRERLANLRFKMNVSAKSGSKITSEDLLSRLQKKDGYNITVITIAFINFFILFILFLFSLFFG